MCHTHHSIVTFKKKLLVITPQVKTRREWTLNVVLFNTVECGFFLQSQMADYCVYYVKELY